MSDTRVDQIAALLADAATIARELDDEVERGHKAHHDLQWLLIRLAQAQSHTTHMGHAFNGGDQPYMQALKGER